MIRILRILWYLFQSALRSFYHSWGLQLSAIGSIAVAFALLGAMYWAFLNVKAGILRSHMGPTISIYFAEDVSETKAKELSNPICKEPFLKKCVFVSKKDAHDLFLKRTPELASALQSLDRNPFPASLEIEIANDFQDEVRLKAFRDRLGKIEGIESIDDGGDWIARWVVLLKTGGRLFWLTVAAIGLSMMFLVSNTIRLIVFARREEIEIQSLVGATDSMIRLPFFIEGVLQGMIGGGVAILAVWGLHRWVAQNLFQDWKGFLLPELEFLPVIVQVLFVIFASVLAFLGSLIAVRRHLR